MTWLTMRPAWIDVPRHVSASDRYVRSGLWLDQKGEYPLGFKLGGKRIGILGLGNVGSEIAKRLVPFGRRIAYTSRKKKPSVSYPFYANIIELAADSVVLIACCGLTEETHHIINEDVLKALGREGVVVNVRRGGLVDEKELVKFLVQGELRGAGLDVFENEPDVPEELIAFDNVVLSPHCAVVTPECFEALDELIAANLKAFFSNETFAFCDQP